METVIYRPSIFLNFSAIIFFLIGSFYSIRSQTVMNLPPVKDNTIYEENDNSNALGDLLAGATGIMNSGNVRRALFKFDLTQIPLNATVVSASLSLTKNRGGSGNCSLHKLLGDWGEGTSVSGPGSPGSNGGGGASPTNGDATWNFQFYNTNSWSSAGGDFVSTASAMTSVGSSNIVYMWTGMDLENDVQEWISNPSLNFGWILIGDESTNSTASKFNSKEAVTGKPSLRIEYTVASSCQDTIELSNNISAGTYHAAQSLTATGLIQSPDVVFFKSGNSVELQIDFTCNLGATLEISIEVCN